MIYLIKKEDVEKLNELVSDKLKEIILRHVTGLTELCFDADKYEEGYNRTIKDNPGYIAFIETQEDFNTFNKYHNIDMFSEDRYTDKNVHFYRDDNEHIIDNTAGKEYLFVYYFLDDGYGVTVIIDKTLLPKDSILFNDIDRVRTI